MDEKVLMYLCIQSMQQNIANHIAEREELDKARRFFSLLCFERFQKSLLIMLEKL
jgi:hypothetical protein